MEEVTEKWRYVYSCDLDVNLEIKIGTLEGERQRPSYNELIDDPLLNFSGACQENCSDLYVTCQIYADGRPLALPICTAYKSFSSRWNWNEWLSFPVSYSDLPRNALLVLTIWDIYGPRKVIPVGGTTVSVFSKHGMLRQGMHDLRVWPGVEGDGHDPSTTPGKTSGKDDEMSRLAKLSRKHRDGQLTKLDWLDRLTFREIEMVNEREKRDSNFMYVMIEFPHIHYEGMEYSVIYFEMGGDEVEQVKTGSDMIRAPDPEILQENLVEQKHHKLARSLRRGPVNRENKPNAATRDHLNSIVGYPPTKTLSSEEEDLVWKFRKYLSGQKKALVKFLKSVNWSVPEEVDQALELMNGWNPMDVADALELLSPMFVNPAVRQYAVARLQQANDDELLLYLLQLVQALKYENFDNIQAAFERQQEQQQLNEPPRFVVRSESTGSATTVPSGDTIDGGGGVIESDSCHSTVTTSRCASVDDMSPSSSEELITATQDSLHDALGLESSATMVGLQMDLCTFLITRACRNPKLANYFCWYLMVECDDQVETCRDSGVIKMYVTVLKSFSLSLKNGGPAWASLRSMISRQQEFMEKLVKLVKLVARESGNRKRKIEKLQALLVDPDILKFNFVNFDPMPLPLDPEVMVQSIIPEEASLFKSALMPCRFTFCTTSGEKYVTIFKHGDDLRQDQLVLQIITLMDQLLQTENLDLKLTPYKVLATNTKHGFLQFIESTAVAEVLATDGAILNFFRKHAPSETGPYGVQPEVIDTYVKSCAGYCVITYLLGVGDRHLDNLLLTTTGKLFHIDFGYILGRDPKPMPPPMKLTREMVEGMGGVTSEHFTDFRKLCYTAFLHLRRSANLILNLFSLMVDANVPDIALEPDKTVKKVQDKFRLDLTDEEAVHYMQSLLDASSSATVAALMEQMHKIAQVCPCQNVASITQAPRGSSTF
ncbi:hypothetical protein NP493_587g04000 [Ridgeia piscesae]|uniref:Phosphatidylinositol 3-kinase catalytic subunit type 3 n=1 Tax=Ridgeia piscesae TaxID=27915 RepID=A0AAD9NSC1_RIDPI|nr:hypothetical protein NP493_587g04000 [Ridgeia piscesae]